MAQRTIQRVLVVEDDPGLAASLRDAFEANDLRTCDSARSAGEACDGWAPDLVVLDVVLAEGDAFDVLAMFRDRSPAPLVVAISGAATAAQAFRLSELGVGAFVAKPFTLDELRAAIERAAVEPPALEQRIRAQVGHRALGEVSSHVRGAMIDEALARTGGNRRNAARLLQISRQLLQYLLRHREQ